MQFIVQAMPTKGCTLERGLGSPDQKLGHGALDFRFVFTPPKAQYERTPHTPAITFATSLHESVARASLHRRTLHSGQLVCGLQITVRFGHHMRDWGRCPPVGFQRAPPAFLFFTTTFGWVVRTWGGTGFGPIWEYRNGMRSPSRIEDFRGRSKKKFELSYANFNFHLNLC